MRITNASSAAPNMANNYREEAVVFMAAWCAAEIIQHAKEGGYTIPFPPDGECVEGYMKGLVADITTRTRQEIQIYLKNERDAWRSSPPLPG